MAYPHAPARHARKPGNGAAGRDAARQAERPTSGSIWWLVLIAGLFMLTELALTSLRTPLGWDEITYIAQTSAHASAVLMPAAHSRGAGLLAAPVTLLTTSGVALRAWMALLSGLGLFAALAAWRGLRPTWVLALAGSILGSLAVMQINGTQVMPDLWEALGALTVTGLFLQATTHRLPRRVVLPLISAVVFFLILVRYEDAAFVLAPLVIGLIVVPAWRQRGVAVAIGVGMIAGAVEWLGEAVAFYGGPAARLHAAAQTPPKFGLYFSLVDQIRVIDGPAYCQPGACPQWRYPDLMVWWAVLILLVVIGTVVSRLLWPVPARLALAVGLSVLIGYTLFVPIAAPRYLIPVVALFTVAAADSMAWLVTRGRWRIPAIVAVAAFLVTGAISQSYVKRSEIKGLDIAQLWVLEAQQLHDLGVAPPCAIQGPGATPVAYYLSCARSNGRGDRLAVLISDQPAHRSGWHERVLSGLKGTASHRGVKVYIRCARGLALPVCRRAAG